MTTPGIVDCAHYAGGKRQDTEQLSVEEASRCARGGSDFIWLGLLDPSDELLSEVGEKFGLHELALEDASRAHQRPKLEEYDGSYFVVLRTARYEEERETVHFGEIHVFAGPGYVITIRHGEASPLASARQRLEARPDLIKLGPASVVWAVLDQVVDDYEPVAGGIEDDIEEVEEQIFTDGDQPTERIYFLKREVIEFHRALWPLLGPLEALERGAITAISDELRDYFRDVADHARRVDEQINSQRELLTSILEANLALVSVRQNEVIKQISSWAALVAVPTFVASVYGMNFRNMPELNWHYGYPLALGLMALLVVALVTFFKKIDWL
jgi:magnesium transporter